MGTDLAKKSGRSPGRAPETGRDAGYWAVRPPEALLRSFEIPPLEVGLRQGHRTRAQNRVAPDASDTCPLVSCHSPHSSLRETPGELLTLPHLPHPRSPLWLRPPPLPDTPLAKAASAPLGTASNGPLCNPRGLAHALCLGRHLSVALRCYTFHLRLPCGLCSVPFPVSVSSRCFLGSQLPLPPSAPQRGLRSHADTASLSPAPAHLSSYSHLALANETEPAQTLTPRHDLSRPPPVPSPEVRSHPDPGTPGPRQAGVTREVRGKRKEGKEKPSARTHLSGQGRTHRRSPEAT